MNKAIIVKADDWEGLFIDNVLVAEGHTLNEGYDRITWISEVSKTYNFDSGEVTFRYVTDDYYENVLGNEGRFRKNLSEIELEE